MNSVISYSGIAAKIRCMKRELLTEEDFRKLMDQKLSMQKAEYLGSRGAYAELFQNVGEDMLHRSGVERRLWLSLFRDFDKLYRFGSVKQKRFIRMYFGHYEVKLVKECLQAVLGGHAAGYEFALYEDLIRKYAKIDIMKLSRSRDIGDFIENLKGTSYYSILKRLYDSGQARAVDYETAIDMRYFVNMWRQKDKVLSREECGIVERTFGSRIDMLNVDWIYRAKKYFDMAPKEIYRLLIPIRYRLSAEEMKKLVEASTLQEFTAVERETCYGPTVRAYVEQTGSLLEALAKFLRHIYLKEARNHPYSIAPINTYLFLKEQEIARIIYIIESTHYENQSGTSPAEEALS